MNITGIIAEYNPFHAGHRYQLSLAKESADAVIVVMSGSFVQRGEAAVFNKWDRTRTALKYGADLVLELPVVFALNTAERFAFGAISILNKIGIADTLIFGSECGDISLLSSAATLLENEPLEVSQKIKKYLEKGMGYPAARELAFEGIIPAKLLSSPNNLLGIEYIRQLLRTNSRIKPITHKRIGADYHDRVIHSDFPSATALRGEILNGYIYDEFSHSVIHRTENLENIILYNIRKNKQSAFSDICDVSEGIENRIVSAAFDSKTLSELEDFVSGKRYTRSKVRRILLSSLLGLNSSLSKSEPSYARVLGASKTGFSLINEIKSVSDIDVITKTAHYKKENIMFDKDILATDIYDLTADIPSGAGSDYKNSPIIGG